MSQTFQRLGIVFLALLAIGVLAATVRAATATDQLPNLEARPAAELRLETTGDGRVLLRASTTSWNSGDGNLELVAGVGNNGKQTVYQRIYRDDGTFEDVPAGDFTWHPLHNHFHFDDYALYKVHKVGDPASISAHGQKTTFCVMDTDRINHRIPNASKKATYRTCGDQVQGMSVGWGDTYRYYLAGQEIDVTSLASGDYEFTIVVDPKNVLIETTDDHGGNAADNTSTIPICLDFTAMTVDDAPCGGGGGGGGGNGNGRGNRPPR